MIFDYKYFYISGNLLLFLFWIAIFIFRKDLRKEQLFLSFIGGFVAPFLDYLIFYKDYWRPDYVIYKYSINGTRLGFESFLCGFLIAGIAGTIYESVFRKKHLNSKPRDVESFIIALFAIFSMLALTKFGLNSIWSSSLTFLIFAIYMIKKDKDIIVDAVVSGLMFLIIIASIYTVLFYFYPLAVEKFWVKENLTGIYFNKIPIEELVWFCTTGISCGIFYEFWKNVRSYKKIK